MLRKIVKMFMGGSEVGTPLAQTHFEALLERVRGKVQAKLSNGAADPLEVIATAVMAEVAGKDAPSSPAAARAYFSVLAENDRLPAGEQLNEDELGLLKSLLIEYFAGDEAVRARANEVLALIERKFSQGAFTQAKILLQIFETDAETKLNNERNLFYEDMIMRLGVTRRHEVPELERDEIRRTFKDLDVKNDEASKAALVWLADEYYINLCISVHVPSELKRWKDVARNINGDARTRLLTYVPPLRWRSPATIGEASIIELTKAHLTPANTIKHVQRLTKMCYFLLLASGDTGFEDFVYRYLAWSRDHLGVEAKRVLPMLHRRSVLDEVGLQDTLDDVFETHFRPKLEDLIDVNDESLEVAWNGVLHQLERLDINDIPPGHYDVGGFLYDQLLGFEQPDHYFGFKLYRLA